MLGTLSLAFFTYLCNEAKLVLIMVFKIFLFDSFGGLGNYPVLVIFVQLDCKKL